MRRTPTAISLIQYIGLRDGEKLYEELLIGENVIPTEHPRIMRSQEPFLPRADLDAVLCGAACGDGGRLRGGDPGHARSRGGKLPPCAARPRTEASLAKPPELRAAAPTVFDFRLARVLSPFSSGANADRSRAADQ